MMIRPQFYSMPLLLSLAVAAPANSAESVYTDVDLNHCQTLHEPAPAGEPDDYVSLKCKGYKDHPLYFKEGDLRQSTYFGYLDQEIIDDAAETFGPFNHIGKKVEWRLGPDRRPFAAILRYHIENPNPDTDSPDKALAGQVLVVSRVGRSDDRRGCVIGYVDALANSEPNELARKVADESADRFACGREKPVFHGIRGEKAGEPVYNFPALTAQ
jgi:hypothetical protein